MNNYRKEIDGLRALAVIPVILFHAGFNLFSGGYIGVYVFFVISGYLITGIILAELKKGSFSIAVFYERRARRILPALFFVLAVCVPFALTWLLPGDLRNFFKSIIAVTVFASNMLFMRQSGYFDTAAELKPLLHTWSLGVEEQFYVLFPLMLIIVWRLGSKWLGPFLIAATVLSFALAQWLTTNNPTHSFFLLPTRGWELLVGALAALYFSKYPKGAYSAQQNILSQCASLVGLAMIVFAIFALDDSTPAPSVYTLIPTIGAILIIVFAWPHTLVGTLLGSKLLVGVGLISYSAYLWHQPLFAFARHRSLHEPDTVVLVGLSLLTFVLAYPTWRFVEQPFRQKPKSLLTSRKQVFLASGFLMVLFAALSVFFIKQSRNNHGSHSAYQEASHRLRTNMGFTESCTKYKTLDIKCKKGSEETFVVYGDSYARQLSYFIEELKPDSTIYQITRSACAPVIGLSMTNSGVHNSKWAKKCIQANDDAISYFSTLAPTTIIIGSPYTNIVSSDLLLSNGSVVQEGQLQLAISALKETVEKIMSYGHSVLIVSPPYNTGENLGLCLAKTQKFDMDSSLCDFSDGNLSDRTINANAVMNATEKNFKILKLSDAHCAAGVCKASIKDTWIFRDEGHLSVEGSRLLASRIGWPTIKEKINHPSAGTK